MPRARISKGRPRYCRICGQHGGGRGAARGAPAAVLRGRRAVVWVQLLPPPARPKPRKPLVHPATQQPSPVPCTHRLRRAALGLPCDQSLVLHQRMVPCRAEGRHVGVAVRQLAVAEAGVGDCAVCGGHVRGCRRRRGAHAAGGRGLEAGDRSRRHREPPSHHPPAARPPTHTAYQAHPPAPKYCSGVSAVSKEMAREGVYRQGCRRCAPGKPAAAAAPAAAPSSSASS